MVKGGRVVNGIHRFVTILHLHEIHWYYHTIISNIHLTLIPMREIYFFKRRWKEPQMMAIAVVHVLIFQYSETRKQRPPLGP